jgi:3-oxoacyl-[acyl-carrier protein] reductase
MGRQRVAVVSGGSRGLGARLVARLLDDDWCVATFSRTPSAAVEELGRAHPDRFAWTAADLADAPALREVATGAVRRFGGIDLLVNNAAVLRQELFLTVSARRVTELVTANLVAPILLTQACARAMSARGGGQVVNVSSINAVRGHRGVAVYSATKAGLDGLGRALARELGPMGIRVNSVVPGFFDSDMTAGVTDGNRDKIARRTPLGRLGTVDEVVDTVLFVISPGSSFLTGQTIVVDGGITC